MAEIRTPDALNYASGAYSLIKGLTTRKPGRYRAQRYNAPVRPAAGDEEALRRTKNEIAQQVSSATQDVNRIVGSDINRGIAARLGVQNNATKAIVDAEANNARLLREDQNRVEQQLSQQEYINSQYANQEGMANWQRDNQVYDNVQAASAQGVQSSLQYIIDKDANERNNAIIQQQAQEQMAAFRATLYADAYNKAIVAGKTDQEAKQIALNASNALDQARGFYPGKGRVE